MAKMPENKTEIEQNTPEKQTQHQLILMYDSMKSDILPRVQTAKTPRKLQF